MLTLIAILAISYLVGAIPTGIMAGKMLKGIDIRQFGSGNAGGTNAFRVLGWKAGLAVTLLDILKGIVAAVSIVAFFRHHPVGAFPDINEVALRLLAGMSAVIGHVFTVFAGFKGGKGVSTAAGMLIGIAPVSMLIVIGIFLLTVYVSRYVSVASILAAIAFPLIIAIRKYIFELGGGLDYYVKLFGERFSFHDSLDYHLMIFGLIVALAILYTHRANIRRLLSGTENRIKFGRHS
ncbi:glycerol-3-phosphate 1-O-acyltransferase PlsY [Chlorobium phaeobacteroides]|jgi:glycerol-3-phosphate acyltransferase PlsY|uniref:Glycerol-3-phosphate acyltransferase n=1 Tax=Chlorobium phaeobacteroides (strain DSM 266 / SMG 266 / 2430) TaxID=290317 RepID=PLSY_CHLPD|nr:glycerol-3-phosphate 1-O-acyltransferase PlsY [Chlorobium phaeobacteroides]A1BJJ2.1 RecName: Full=Glycerol-3-phosphate acyltransferase; AltName: Full=Acyl-PO4 G3P acyltransferase; AltName: Full=Acyl-phosphate--glycerol-3-phosphate acyltransferase; AltName: Full=G3P acyltransferase; Short=GPAT; AltName: Full=Lysophosphatidic acid synthase; Short=LPA synthase [Chlorobium phaeobacteroides DSM 266]ABL66569.1 acyl-phosphate glycerol-3-phosphate acyltransferase [Chlorobium phaeobacteroides DSM 266]